MDDITAECPVCKTEIVVGERDTMGQETYYKDEPLTCDNCNKILTLTVSIALEEITDED